MNITSCAAEFKSELSLNAFIAIPGILWDSYLQYLWYYERNSWVEKIACFCRLFSILMSVPLIILGSLDIIAYCIARIFGIVDSQFPQQNKNALHDKKGTSLFVSSSTSGSSVNYESDRDPTCHHHEPNANTKSFDSSSILYPPHVYYATDSDEGNLTLSGVGVFSPAITRTSSPVAMRNGVLREEKTSWESDEGLRLRSKDK